ncbi:MAG: 3-oxoacyl-ACP synthase III family protein [Byssovorax sp.]
MIATRILGTGSVLPGRAVTTAEVAALAAPERIAAELEAKIGIRTRHWSGPDARVAPIAAEALRRALVAAGIEASALRRIILATSTGGDTLVPATANAVACELGLHGVCDAFDVNNACSGFLTAFDLGARSTATGLGPVGVVAVELMSHVIRKEDPRPFLVFGDGAGAVVLGAGRPGEGVTGVSLGNDGSHGSTAFLSQPRYAGAIETVRFGISNQAMSEGAVGKIVESARRALAEAGERIEDVAWVLPHQPNGTMLEGIIAALGVDRARVVPVVQEIGSVASASIPVSLDRLMRTRPVAPGDRILMTAVGSGVSWGAILYRVGG